MTIRATWTFNGQTKIVLGNWHRHWCLLFGPFYYLFKGMILWAILSLITANGLWGGFPLFNRAIVSRHYHRKGGAKNDRPSSLPPEWNPAHGAETQRECGPYEKARQFGSGSHPTD